LTFGISETADEMLGARAEGAGGGDVEVGANSVSGASNVSNLNGVGGSSGGLGADTSGTRGIGGASGAGGHTRPDVVVCGSLRRDEGDLGRFLLALAELWVTGTKIDWSTVCTTSGKRVRIPGYAFQRSRYWLDGSMGGNGDARLAGQAQVDHPFLAAAVPLADGGCVLTGHLSTGAAGWLADYSLDGITLLPSAVFVELALAAGAHVGCELVEEITLDEPLVLSERGGVRLQLSVGEPGSNGQRTFGVYSDSDGADELLDCRWTRHASGVLSPVVQPATDERERLSDGRAWPPANAEPIEIDRLYDLLADAGCDYGPAFHGLRAAWRRGSEVFAEVHPEDDLALDVDRFGLHPALL
jgi:acyl transferase domain-containing protein